MCARRRPWRPATERIAVITAVVPTTGPRRPRVTGGPRRLRGALAAVAAGAVLCAPCAAFAASGPSSEVQVSGGGQSAPAESSELRDKVDVVGHESDFICTLVAPELPYLCKKKKK